jgi:hypothetical protein
MDGGLAGKGETIAPPLAGWWGLGEEKPAADLWVKDIVTVRRRFPEEQSQHFAQMVPSAQSMVYTNASDSTMSIG